LPTKDSALFIELDSNKEWNTGYHCIKVIP
jgi:hypothetical protein